MLDRFVWCGELGTMMSTLSILGMSLNAVLVFVVIEIIRLVHGHSDRLS